MNYQLWFKEIYEKIFKQTYDESYYVFLCGGAGPNCIRDDVRNILERRGYQIFYPEDLFADAVYLNKREDLLTNENSLADNADVVCVICESIGSAAELGAFAQSETINQRLVAGINQRYVRQKSFIMLGPVRFLNLHRKGSVISYNPKLLEAFCDNLERAFSSIRRKCRRPFHDKREFEVLSTYIALIPILLFFFQAIEREILFQQLKGYIKVLPNGLPKKYSSLFNSAIQYLVTSRTISVAHNSNEGEIFSLTSYGQEKVRVLLAKSRISYPNRLCDKIRCGIMNSATGRRPHPLADT